MPARDTLRRISGGTVVFLAALVLVMVLVGDRFIRPVEWTDGDRLHERSVWDGSSRFVWNDLER